MYVLCTYHQGFRHFHPKSMVFFLKREPIYPEKGVFFVKKRVHTRTYVKVVFFLSKKERFFDVFLSIFWWFFLVVFLIILVLKMFFLFYKYFFLFFICYKYFFYNYKYYFLKCVYFFKTLALNMFLKVYERQKMLFFLFYVML